MTNAPTVTADPHSSAPHPSRGVAITLLAVMATLYFFSYFQRSAIPGTIFNEIQSEWKLSATAVAGLGAMFVYIYGGMQVAVGAMAHHLGGKRALLLGGIVMVAGGSLFPLAPSAALLYASRALTAVGASFMYICIIDEIDQLFPAKQFPLLLGLLLAVGYAGGIAGTLPFERTVALVGWRPSLLVVAALMAAALAITWLALRKFKTNRRVQGQLSFRMLWDILRNRRSLPLLAYGMINFPIYFTFQSVLGKKFLEDFVGLKSSTAATFILCMIVVSATMAIVSGLLLRLMGQRRKACLMACGSLMIVATVFMLYGVTHHAGGWVFLTSYLLMAASVGSGPVGSTVMKELNRPDAVALSISVLNGLTYVGGGLIANLAGLVLDQFKRDAVVTAGHLVYPCIAYVTLFAILVGLSIMSLAILSRVPETRGQQATKGHGRP